MRGNTPRVHIVCCRVEKWFVFILLIVCQKTFVTNAALQPHLKPPLSTTFTVFHLMNLQTPMEVLVIKPIDRIDKRRLRRGRKLRSRRKSEIRSVIGGRRSNTDTSIVSALAITSTPLSECMSRPLRKVWIVPS